MAELVGKKQRLRKAITKLKEMNNTNAMKSKSGGAAAGWDGLASELSSSAASFSSVITNLSDKKTEG
ncbi:MAG: hypothetical protein K2X81_04625 [Candidatus Obscuribacterales bacterium]|nr:hypothetical protein [Candidatus Obscuribacterales bacterium]